VDPPGPWDGLLLEARDAAKALLLIPRINTSEFVKNFTIFLAKDMAHSVHPVLDGARGWRTRTAGAQPAAPEKTVDGPQSLGKNTRSLMPEFGSGSDVPKQSRLGA
jgi:hypothetical protein